jgi:hypothetical protein
VLIGFVFKSTHAGTIIHTFPLKRTEHATQAQHTQRKHAGASLLLFMAAWFFCGSFRLLHSQTLNTPFHLNTQHMQRKHAGAAPLLFMAAAAALLSRGGCADCGYCGGVGVNDDDDDDDEVVSVIPRATATAATAALPINAVVHILEFCADDDDDDVDIGEILRQVYCADVVNDVLYDDDEDDDDDDEDDEDDEGSDESEEESADNDDASESDEDDSGDDDAAVAAAVAPAPVARVVFHARRQKKV